MGRSNLRLLGHQTVMQADAVVLVDDGANRLFVDSLRGITFREQTNTKDEPCRQLRPMWESIVRSSRLVEYSSAGQFETMVSGVPVALLDWEVFPNALYSALDQLVGLGDASALGHSRAAVDYGFQVLEFSGQMSDLHELNSLRNDLGRCRLVPAGSDNSPHNALFDGKDTSFIDVCPVRPLPEFVRPFGLAASWTGSLRVPQSARWSTEVRALLAKSARIESQELNDSLLLSLTRLAIACDGTAASSLEDARNRFLWLMSSYRL